MRAQIDGSPEPVVFYLPHRGDGIGELPQTPEEYWPWLLRHRGINEGKYSWTLQTCLQLRAAGFACTLSATFPERGVVVAHRDFLPVILRPRRNVFLICIKPDRNEHTWAHFYIVQNSRDAVVNARKGRGRTAVLPFWPQPGLVRRDSARDATCRNVAYIGRDGNLATELKAPEWERELAALGFSWNRPAMERWHDYGGIDVTVAARSFGANATNLNSVYDVDSKPPSKLINSWLAGVPAIVGAESAYRNIRQSELDFIEATGPAEMKEALLRLSRDPKLYRDMVAHGLHRSEAYSAAAIGARWVEVLRTEIGTSLAEWAARPGVARTLRNYTETAAYFGSLKHLRGLLTIFK